MDKKLNTSDFKYDLIDISSYYTKNNTNNKTVPANTRCKIINALFQFEENVHKTISQLNAYDASSILVAESNWMKRNHFSRYMPSKEAPTKVAFGQVCSIDYGKVYKGEMGYIHPGLCIGKKGDKYLIIPITSGKNWRNKCYHPTVNPTMTKEHRQALEIEGFAKDEVLLMNDARFISGGRILELHEIIKTDILEDIKNQLFYIMFPHLFKYVSKLESDNERQLRNIENMKNRIKNLEKENNIMSAKVQQLENEINSRITE